MLNRRELLSGLALSLIHIWIGYAIVTAAAWKPGPRSMEESAAAFYQTFYGDHTVNMDRLYRLMSLQAHFWLDSWEWRPSPRKPIFGNSNSIYKPRHQVKDQTLPLPAQAGIETWMRDNNQRLALTAGFLAENDELLGLLHQNLRTAEWNRYNLEVYISIAELCRQNLEFLLDVRRICSLLESAGTKTGKAAVGDLDFALGIAAKIKHQRNLTLHDAEAAFYKSWFPRVAQANGRTFLHELDDVKDHVPDRTIDLSYLIERELQLPFGEWVESIRVARNRIASANGLEADPWHFDWADLTTSP